MLISLADMLGQVDYPALASWLVGLDHSLVSWSFVYWYYYPALSCKWDYGVKL